MADVDGGVISKDVGYVREALSDGSGDGYLMYPVPKGHTLGDVVKLFGQA